MLELYGAIARGLRPYLAFIWAAAAAALGLLAWSLLLAEGTAGEPYALGATCALLWALSLVVLVHQFERPAPAVDPAAGFVARLTVRLKRGARWVVAAAMTALLGAVVFFSVRAIGILA